MNGAVSLMKNWAIRGTLLLTAGAVLICAGLYREETAIIFRKAVHVCLECIGIG